MKKTFLLLIVLGAAFLLNSQSVFTQSITQEDAPTAEKTKAVNVGNKVCPVSGEKIDEKLKATYEYEGKIYNFCCTACIEEFKKDPEKYIKKVEEELSAKNKEQKEEMQGMGMMQGEGSSMGMSEEHGHHHH